MVHIIGAQTSDTLASAGHYFYTHHLPHLTPSPCTQTCVRVHTHRYGSFTASAVSSSKNDWACDSFSHCCVDTNGAGERRKCKEDDRRWWQGGVSERKNFCCLLSLVWGGMSGARQFRVHSAGFVLNYQSRWVSEVCSLMQEETVVLERIIHTLNGVKSLIVKKKYSFFSVCLTEGSSSRSSSSSSSSSVMFCNKHKHEGYWFPPLL